MIELLRHIDYKLFHFINTDLANPVFDIICPVLRNKHTWIPLYLLIAYFFQKRFGYAILTLGILAAITVLLTDQISSSLIKPLVHRLRPCNNPAIQARLVIEYCGAGYSFVSSHAANHFGIAAFLSVFVSHQKGYGTLLFSWAFLVSASQIYVGVHFPIDVIAGALLGIGIGFTVALLGKKYVVPATIKH